MKAARSDSAAALGHGTLAGAQRRLSKLNFRTKLAIISTSICLACLLVAGVTIAIHQEAALEQVLRQRAQTLAAVVAANSEAAVSFDDAVAARLVLANLAPDSSVEEAQLLLPELPGEAALRRLAAFTRHGATPQALPDLQPGKPMTMGDQLYLLQPVRQGDEAIGYLYLRVRMAELEALQTQLAKVTAALVALVVLLAWFLSRQLQGVVTRPVTELLTTTDAVRRSKNYGLRARVLGEDELGELTEAVNAMLAEVQAHDRARERVEADIRELNEQLEHKVRARTEDLQASNLDLQEAIGSLRRTQRQLVESEKLAALGALVAGVAHEINTPLGVCVTVASHFAESVDGLQRAYRDGMRRSDLEQFIADAGQALEIINGNLRRAADLVRSFKQVAVDQGSEERRQIDIAEYLAEVMNSLRPELKRQKVRFALDCPVGIMLDSYPGVIAQILTNLSINACQHAFADQADPQIRISGRRHGLEFELSFEDNGVGMSDEVQQRIFEPFFTTRRASGGSGLGLHIVHNQVHKTLHGSIECMTREGGGSRFVLRMPISTPPAEKPAAPV